MFEVGVVSRFHATHRLVGDFGPAKQPHAHDYSVRLAVRAVHLREDGTVCDIAWLRGVLEELLSRFDGRDLNDTPPFETRNPTAEGVAEYLAAGLGPQVASAGLSELAVEVWEDPAGYARYETRLTS